MSNVIVKEINNRNLVLAIDYLYREDMKRFEVGALLPAASKLVELLSLSLVDVPVEGYYTENEDLTKYFLKIKTLQNCTNEDQSRVVNEDSYKKLSKTMSSEIFGYGKKSGFFPQRLDSLYYALMDVPVNDWKVSTITEVAYELSEKNNDISLTGIAASLKDSVVLTALRESIALYGAVAAGCAMEPPEIRYEWNVDSKLEDSINQFIDRFNILTESSVKNANAQNVEYFYDAFEENKIAGRCIFIGLDDRKDPIENYHWAIKYSQGDFIVDDFWSTDIWTTERYEKE